MTLLMILVVSVYGFLSYNEKPYDYTNVFPTEGDKPTGTKCTKVDASKYNKLFSNQ